MEKPYEPTTVIEWLENNNPIAVDIWKNKYQYEGETFSEWLTRVSGSNTRLRQLIIDKKFLFGGRILAGRGLQQKGLKVTYSNCYVIPSPEDDLESIYQAAFHMAKTYAYGGGVGVDISKLAPRGAKVNNAANTTSGAVSFMPTYSQVTGQICQSGRRGALMITLSSDHPDLEEFIAIKSDLNSVTKANISVRAYDDLFQEAKEMLPHTLYFKREPTGEEIRKEVSAKDLLYQLAKINWDYAEPGMLFWNRVMKWNLTANNPNFVFESVNPLTLNMRI